MNMKMRNIGFLSTRFAGTDGVSLETAKWAEVLEGMGHPCFYFAGELDRPLEKCYLAPRAHFEHPEISSLNDIFFKRTDRPQDVTDKVERIKRELLYEIERFVNSFKIHILVVENALAIPLNIPLGLAITEYISKTCIPTIAHHHDFYWERKRFSRNCVWDYLNIAFPPRHPYVRHVVINSEARSQLAFRKGASAIVIPNVMNFAVPPEPLDEYALDVKKTLGIGDDEYFMLQPTRIIQRKGIEHSIELVSRLKRKKIKARLIISHASGDEGDDYQKRVKEYSRLLGVNTLFVSDLISQKRGRIKRKNKVYTLFDVYPHADVVTYPSSYEGFGNAFLEAIYFKKPILVNNYSIYLHDIKPKGFKVIEMDEYLKEETVEGVIAVLKDKEKAKRMAEHNYKLARRFYSFENLKRKLRFILTDFFGEE